MTNGILQNLKFKKALLFMEIEFSEEVNTELLLQFGKIEFEILKIEKEIIRAVVNDFD